MLFDIQVLFNHYLIQTFKNWIVVRKEFWTGQKPWLRRCVGRASSEDDVARVLHVTRLVAHMCLCRSVPAPSGSRLLIQNGGWSRAYSVGYHWETENNIKKAEYIPRGPLCPDISGNFRTCLGGR